MKRSIARKWAKALESGEYKQGHGQLRTLSGSFCCLGVLCNIHAEAHPEIATAQKNSTQYLDQGAFLPDEVMQWSGAANHSGMVHGKFELIELNDNKKLTFPEIAKIIRKHYKEL